MSTQAVQDLERRAEEQRREIHQSAEELKGKISEAKQKLDISTNIREHLFAVAVGIGAAALLIGTVIARRFKQ